MGLNAHYFCMKTSTKQTIRIYWQHSKRYPWTVGFLIFGIFFLVGIDIYKPFLYKRFFDELVVANSNRPENLLHILFLILLLGIGNNLAWRTVLFVNNFFQPRVMSDLLNTCYEYIQKNGYRFFSDNFVGSLVTKVRRYQRSFETIADQITFDAGRTAIITVSIIIALTFVNLRLSLITLGWAIIFVTYALLFSRYKYKFDIKRASTDTKATAQLADSVTNSVNIKLFTSHSIENKRFSSITNDLFQTSRRSWNLDNYAEVVQGFMIVALEVGMIYYSILLWQRGLMTVGDFVLVQSYLGRIFEKLWQIGKNIRKTYEALADAEEMTDILSTPHEVIDVQGAQSLSIANGKIQFDNVTFGYEKQEKILNKFDLMIIPGERVALIGPSGGGKTTIVKLLFRFFDIQSGKIKIDDQDISKVTQDSLRDNLALVPQDPILFHRSLYDNIAYALPNADRDDVIKAAKLAHAHEFISRFSNGYETFVGERGIKLSGGERQRIAIARAILKNAPILVLDEATSSLDSESEMLIQDALKNLMEKKTTIVIAHRLSTIMQMDRIIVIEGGKVIEEGKHKELLKVKQGTYQKLWEIQAGGFVQSK